MAVPFRDLWRQLNEEGFIFEGGLFHAVEAANASPNWTQDSGFVLCTECFNTEHP